MLAIACGTIVSGNPLRAHSPMLPQIYINTTDGTDWIDQTIKRIYAGRFSFLETKETEGYEKAEYLSGVLPLEAEESNGNKQT